MLPFAALLAGAAAPAVAPRPSRASAGTLYRPAVAAAGGCALSVECSSRPQKKGTKHHMKTRPKKTQRWDIKRRPTSYPPRAPLPADWTLVAAGADNAAPQEGEEEEVDVEPAPAAVVEVVAAPAAAD